MDEYEVNGGPSPAQLEAEAQARRAAKQAEIDALLMGAYGNDDDEKPAAAVRVEDPSREPVSAAPDVTSPATEDLPGAATLNSDSTAITAEQPRPPVPLIDDLDSPVALPESAGLAADEVAAPDAPPVETPEQAAAREAAEADAAIRAAAAKEAAEKAREEEKKFHDSINQAQIKVMSAFALLLHTHPSAERLINFLQQKLKAHMTMMNWAPEEFYQASSAQLVILLQQNILPGIARFAEKNLQSLFVSSRIPQSWVRPLTEALGFIVAGRIRDPKMDVEAVLEHKLNELIRQGERDGSISAEHWRYMAQYARDMAAAKAADEAAGPAGGPVTEPIAATPDSPLPPTATPEKAEIPGQNDEIFMERVNISERYNSRLEAAKREPVKAAEITGMNDDEAREHLDPYVKAQLAREFGSDIDIHRTVIRKVPTYYIEFSVLDKDECKRFKKSVPNSTVVRLVSEGRGPDAKGEGDFTVEELRVLRTFDERSLKDTGELPDRPKQEDFLDVYFQPDPSLREYIDPSTGERVTVIQQQYDRYKENLSHLFHILNAFSKADEESKSEKTDSVVARHMQAKLDDLVDTAGNIKGDLIIHTPEVRRSTDEIDPEHYIDNTRKTVEWTKSRVLLQDAFQHEIRPLIRSIYSVIASANSANDETHDPSKKVQDVMKREIKSEDMAYVLRAYPGLVRAMQISIESTQRSIARVDRLFSGDYGRREGVKNREQAESETIALLALEWMGKGGKVTPRKKAEFEYLAKLAGGAHKVYTGEFWNVHTSAMETEAGTVTDIHTGEQKRIRSKPESAVAAKLFEMAFVEDQMYGSESNASARWGLFVNRYFGKGNSSVDTLEHYRLNADAMAMARRPLRKPGVGASSEEKQRYQRSLTAIRKIQETRRQKVSLGDVLKVSTGDELAKGGWHSPVLEADFALVRREVEDEKELTGFRMHKEVIDRLREKWGHRGAINYIAKNLDEFMKLDPEYEADVKRVSRMTAQMTGTTSIELLKELKDRAFGKYLAEYVYKDLIQDTPARVLLLQHRSLTDPEKPLIRNRMALWLSQQLDDREESSLMDKMRLLEVVASYSTNGREYRPVSQDQIAEVSKILGIQLSDDMIRRLTELSPQFDRALVDFVDKENTEGSLAKQFGTDHALKLGSFDAQLTGPDVDYSQVIALNLNVAALSGLDTQVEVKALERALTGAGGELSKLELKDEASTRSAGGIIGDKIADIVKKMTANEQDQLRIGAYLATICVDGLFDKGKGETVFGKHVKNPNVSKEFLRYVLMQSIAARLGIVEDEIKTVRGIHGPKRERRPVSLKDLYREIGANRHTRNIGGAIDRFFKGFSGSAK